MVIRLDEKVTYPMAGAAPAREERSALLDVQLLGPLTLRPPGDPPLTRAAFGTAKNRALMVMLAWHVDRPLPCASILDALWPDAAPGRGRASLRTAASALRHLIGDHIVREADALRLYDAEVDAVEFE